MQFITGFENKEQQISDLFTASFTDAESPAEGALIGAFVRDLMTTTPKDALHVVSAYDGDALLGCVFLSQLTFPQDGCLVFILSPVAVKIDQQKRGVGQKLIAHGLDALRQKGVDFVVTYGDPNYYCKTGFTQITEDIAQAPLPLSMPAGWLGQALRNSDQRPLIGPSQCVPALNNPELW